MRCRHGQIGNIWDMGVPKTLINLLNDVNHELLDRMNNQREVALSIKTRKHGVINTHC